MDVDYDKRCELKLIISHSMDLSLGTTVVLPGRGIVQVVDKKAVGDRGLEPLTSTVCRKRYLFWTQFGHKLTGPNGIAPCSLAELDP
ncbi:MAG: hypothetical protein A2V45_06990 [Candidatus Aminicenantes bacterium RBG_19FT_COMBO_58_17]|nr:MAG: hypothetical protein A2V45_06990 [Candidatus Aminicenantes bacterium RBG_19FT_COMBO_58_17]